MLCIICYNKSLQNVRFVFTISKHKTYMKKEVSPYVVYVGSEAPIGLRSGSAATGNAGQENHFITLSQPENHRYTELLQEFFQYLERWRSVVSTPKYYFGKELKDRYISEKGQRWGFDI